MLRDANKPLPIDDYEKFYYLSQALIFDFSKNVADAEKIKTFALAYLTAKETYEKYCLPKQQELGITKEDINEYFTVLMNKSLI